MVTIAGVEGTRRNNFDCARLALAALVIYSHAFALLGEAEAEPLYRVTRSQMVLGTLSVYSFFAISGFLITQSWHANERIAPFFLKRILRIYPAFIAASLVCLLVVAPISSWQTMRVGWEDVASALIRLVTLAPPALKGAFPTNPIAGALNSSLWTIRFEFCAYILTALLGFVGFFRSRPAVLVAAIAVAVLQSLIRFGVLSSVPILNDTVAPVTVDLATFYVGGTAVYIFRDRVPISAWLAASAACILVLPLAFAWATEPSSASKADVLATWFHPAAATAGVYLLFWFAFTPRISLSRFAKRGDFSYGVYVYAYPIEQMLVLYFGPELRPITLFIVALAFTLPVAVLSWHLVEKGFLKLKPNDRARRDEDLGWRLSAPRPP